MELSLIALYMVSVMRPLEHQCGTILLVLVLLTVDGGDDDSNAADDDGEQKILMNLMHAIPLQDTGVMQVSFESDGSIVRDGFIAKYWCGFPTARRQACLCF